MKMFMKATMLLLSAGIILGSFSVALGQTAPAVYVDIYEVGGLADGYIPIQGADITIPIRFKNDNEFRTSIINSFKIVGDGVTWDSVTGAWNAQFPWDIPMAIQLMQFPPFFDQDLSINYFENGLAFSGLAGSAGSGLPLGFDDIAYTITISGVTGGYYDVLTLDSVNFLPPDINPAWTWSGSEIDVAWGGPYEFRVEPNPMPTPSTYCWPQPTILKKPLDDRILEVYIHNEYNADRVDLNSVRVNNIPPYTEARVGFFEIITDVSLMRFLGVSGFRPIPPEGIQSTYTVTYNYTNGTSATPLYGDYVLQVFQGDVTLDGIADIADVQFMAEFFWGKGQSCEFEEFMDVDGNGRVDIRDALKVIDIVEI